MAAKRIGGHVYAAGITRSCTASASPSIAVSTTRRHTVFRSLTVSLFRESICCSFRRSILREIVRHGRNPRQDEERGGHGDLWMERPPAKKISRMFTKLGKYTSRFLPRIRMLFSKKGESFSTETSIGKKNGNQSLSICRSSLTA